jgi:peptide/nickel transport system substrate-binding protein
VLSLVAMSVLTAGPALAADRPAGSLTIGVHVTLVNRWMDPGDVEGLITPFMVLYMLHDALVKPMPGSINTPSLAESWSVSCRPSGSGRACGRWSARRSSRAGGRRSSTGS